jgi:3-phenylpropionate/cinnamic acid dioxygenase small subunit
MLTIEEISDRLEIQDLLIRYSHAVDTWDWDLYRTVFTEDAYIDYSEFAGGVKGTVDEIVAFLAGTMPTFKGHQHMVGNTVLEIDGDTAKSRTICFNPMVMDVEGQELVFFCGLWYRDQLVRTAEGWKIKHRYEERLYQFNQPEGLASPED